jgi:hypothetical protein
MEDRAQEDRTTENMQIEQDIKARFLKFIKRERRSDRGNEGNAEKDWGNKMLILKNKITR